MAMRFVPETRDPTAPGRIDWLGGTVLVVGLGAGVYALIEGPANGWTLGVMALELIGVVALVLFVVIERRVANPMVPLSMFRSRQFSGANAVTLLFYAALSGVLFLLVVHLQTDMGYSALEAGAALLPVTVCSLLLSPRMGALSQRIGPRIPMAVGPLIAGVGLVLLRLAEPGRSYWVAVLPGAIVLGLGLSTTVAPLTTAVLAAAGDARAGIGSAINTAVARVAGLLAIAILPAVAGLTTSGRSLDLVDGFGTAMLICGVACALGGLVAAALIRTGTPIRTIRRADTSIPCPSPYLSESGVDAA
jgi:Na+/melibiose symporter-like transporter